MSESRQANHMGDMPRQDVCAQIVPVDSSDLLSAAQAAEILGITRQAVIAKLARRPDLGGRKIGKSWLLPRAAIPLWMRDRDAQGLKSKRQTA